ncbi:MAG: HdeD family acid-resistance protein [Candidatus Sulfotelmatobacter sp.]|jgi:uncharacterized membrane protein HdeD (DUF308 family)
MTTLETGLKRASGTSLALSIILIIFGLVAIALPLVSSIGVAIVIGWMVIFAGIAQLVHAFQSTGIGPIVWKVLVALIYLVAGFSLIARPVAGVAGLTLVLGVFLFAEGIADVVAYFATRKSGSSPWMLLDGIITLILGFLIWNRWPSSSLWVIGTFVGISMVMTGTTRFMMALAVRRVASHLSDTPLQKRAA